jgi:hypothetical protein
MGDFHSARDILLVILEVMCKVPRPTSTSEPISIDAFSSLVRADISRMFHSLRIFIIDTPTYNLADGTAEPYGNRALVLETMQFNSTSKIPFELSGMSFSLFVAAF